MPRTTVANISLSAMRHNLAGARRQAGPQARIWAVVKADAYGHGLDAALEAFGQPAEADAASPLPDSPPADGFGLIEFEGATRLRQLGWRGPVLMMEGAFDPTDLSQAAAQGLTLVVHDTTQIDWLANHRGTPLPVLLKVNTDMSRLGLAPEQVPAAWARLARMPAVASLRLMTHYAQADRPGGTTAPRAVLNAVRQALPVDPPAGHGTGFESVPTVANSAALFRDGGEAGSWVRPGIVLYGATPFSDRSAAELHLRPAMTLRSTLIAVRELEPGTPVGYGGHFRAPAAMRIGTVACGYADGYPRVAPTGTPIAVDGVRTRIIGRVSMDMLCVDLDPVPQARVGSRVELWGGLIPVDEVAHCAGTVGYELLCAVAPRVPRRWVA